MRRRQLRGIGLRAINPTKHPPRWRLRHRHQTQHSRGRRHRKETDSRYHRASGSKGGGPQRSRDYQTSRRSGLDVVVQKQSIFRQIAAAAAPTTRGDYRRRPPTTKDTMRVRKRLRITSLVATVRSTPCPTTRAAPATSTSTDAPKGPKDGGVWQLQVLGSTTNRRRGRPESPQPGSMTRV